MNRLLWALTVSFAAMAAWLAASCNDGFEPPSLEVSSSVASSTIRTAAPSSASRSARGQKSDPQVEHVHRAALPPMWPATQRNEATGAHIPPIDRSAAEEEPPAPTALDLADPEHYADFEQRRQEWTRQQFIRAAEQRLPAWRAALAEARARGLPPDRLVDAPDKIARLELMLERLRKGDAPQR